MVPPPPPKLRLTSHDRVRIAAVGGVAPVTVKRIYSGKRSASTTFDRVRQAAEELGLPPPPEAEPEPSLSAPEPEAEVA